MVLSQNRRNKGFWSPRAHIDREITELDTKFDALNHLLTDNLLEMKGDIGELKGASHSHNTLSQFRSARDRHTLTPGSDYSDRKE